MVKKTAARHSIKTASFHTLGCKLNQAETDSLAEQFRNAGITVVPFRQPADLTVINTCTVTNEADAKSRQAIRKAIRSSPRGRIAAVGCYAQVSPDQLTALNGVDLVLGTRDKHNILQVLSDYESGGTVEPLIMVTPAGEIDTYDNRPFVAATSRSRAFLKVQDGCDYTCSYCIVPAARGRGRSRPLEACLDEARKLVDRGYLELVLTGVNIGSWRDGKHTFQALLDRLSRLSDEARIRISSIEPNLLTPELLQLMNERRNICPHFHIPLQHASDRILASMRRRYSFSDFADLVTHITSLNPDAAVGTDVIVGFPGETDEDFNILADALAALPLSYHHIFRYSERMGTAAANLPGQLAPQIRKERSSILHEISRKKKREYGRRFIGKTVEVYFEQNAGSENEHEGVSPNYLRVSVTSPGDLKRTIRPVKLDSLSPDGLKLKGSLAA